MRVSRQGVIAALVEAANVARELREPSSMISAFKNVALICGYMNHKGRDEVRPPVRGDDKVMGRLQVMTDAELVKIIEAGATSVT
jgi:hypothetical protein